MEIGLKIKKLREQRKTNFEELKNSPISLVRIQFSGESKDYVVKNELISESLKIKTNPSNYFMEFLKCVE